MTAPYDASPLLRRAAGLSRAALEALQLAKVQRQLARLYETSPYYRGLLDQAKLRPDALKQQVASDSHSPARFRVDGPLRNVDAWYDAFGVNPGDALYLKPEDRAHIW